MNSARGRGVVRRGVLVALVVVACFVLLSAAPGKPRAGQDPHDGQRLYMAYCARCHGGDALGGGPAASVLRTRPPDLTALSSHNNGRFPYQEVYLTLKGDPAKNAHGSKEMPVWGPIFLAESGSSPADVERRIHNLTKYIESLQSGLEARLRR